MTSILKINEKFEENTSFLMKGQDIIIELSFLL